MIAGPHRWYSGVKWNGIPRVWLSIARRYEHSEYGSMLLATLVFPDGECCDGRASRS